MSEFFPLGNTQCTRYTLLQALSVHVVGRAYAQHAHLRVTHLSSAGAPPAPQRRSFALPSQVPQWYAN